jgi:hypothetical protein
MFETLCFQSSPIKRNHKLTDCVNGLVKECHHSRKLFSVQTQPLKCLLTSEHYVLSLHLVGTKQWQGHCHDIVILKQLIHHSHIFARCLRNHTASFILKKVRTDGTECQYPTPYCYLLAVKCFQIQFIRTSFAEISCFVYSHYLTIQNELHLTLSSNK